MKIRNQMVKKQAVLNYKQTACFCFAIYYFDLPKAPLHFHITAAGL